MMRPHTSAITTMTLSTRGALAGLLALTLSASACDKDLTGLNENPNAPTDVDPEFLFPQGVTAVVNLVRGTGFDLHLTSLWAQHYAKIQYVDEDWYQIRPQSIDAYWSAFYSGGLQDLTATIEKAETDPRAERQASKGNFTAPPMIMKAWTFGAMTDIWGDIPYSEANLGADGPITPAYDTQQEVYDGIFASLATAAAAIDPGGANYGDADPIYAGDMDKWQKFANSLRLRYAMRLTKANLAKAQSEYTAALAAPGGVFTSNDDNAQLVWPGDGTNDNPFYTNFRTRDDHRVSKAMVDTLKALNDPRLSVYARPTADDPSQFVGVQNGLPTDEASLLGLSKTSKIGLFFSSPTSPSVLMAYSEVLFIRAEAAARGWGGNAALLYNEAITASMKVYGISDAAIATYLAQPRVVYNPTTGLQQIALQKWISLFNQGAEAYAEWRRTGVPTLTAGSGAITAGGVVARRLTYPVIEQSLNNANLNAAMSAQGGTELENRVWWDRP